MNLHKYETLISNFNDLKLALSESDHALPQGQAPNFAQQQSETFSTSQ